MPAFVEPPARRGMERQARRLEVLVVALGVVLLGRLTYLQVVKGSELKALSEANRVRIVRMQAPRGEIVDRYGHLMAGNRYAFNLTAIPADIKDAEKLLSLLAGGVDLDLPAARSKIAVAQRHSSVLLKYDLLWSEVAFVEEHKLDLPGVHLRVQPLRYYPEEQMAAHMLGYVGEISETQLNSGRFPDLTAGDIVGKYGLELQYDSMLRGAVGKKYVEVDAYGRELGELVVEPPSPGRTLVLSIDWGLQRLAEQLLEDHAGAIVAMDPRNGDILAMASSPSFDPNSFSRGISNEEWQALRTDPHRPLHNRALQGEYPPGSTYKIVTLTASLEEGLIQPETTFNCPGGYFFGRRMYQCWKGGGHGVMDAHNALVHSCDVYFYNLASRLDIDTLARYAKGFGLGRNTGIALAGESCGLVPSSLWKYKRFGEPWFPGESLSAAIGQSYDLVTPLQMANLMSALANGGTLFEPHLVKRIEGSNGVGHVDIAPSALGRLPARAATLQFIREALRDVVNEQHGTGQRARLAEVSVAGKTGTAQVVKLGTTPKAEDTGQDFEDHAWFIAFAPFEEPRIALALLLEHGGKGGSVAAPLARRIMEEYFGLDVAQDNTLTLTSR